MSGKKVLAAGKFDILHLGHLAYLNQARELAGKEGILVVVIARDDTIERERGAPPVFPQEQRRKLVESLQIVDKAIVGYETTDHTKIVRDLSPDIIALGYDQKTDIDALQNSFASRGVSTQIVRLKKQKADGLCSSTLIRERIIKYYAENGRVRD
ncbi:MAG: adenylyltransferase/cytidyltransferase family protein [Candidatus Lokiarchaeota archaeon]|nr:adenylyltransferase/cytidyltransferase family protein [Candidatus Lokiarchaeota archaeon]